MSDENKTCEYCDRLVNSPNFSYHFCTGRKSASKQAAQQNVHLTAFGAWLAWFMLGVGGLLGFVIGRFGGR